MTGDNGADDIEDAFYARRAGAAHIDAGVEYEFLTGSSLYYYPGRSRGEVT